MTTTERRNQSGERRAVRRILRALKAAGWSADYVNDGGALIRTSTESAVMGHVFSVDTSNILFTHPDYKGRMESILIVLGNADDGSEVAADWSCGLPAFDRAVEAATAE